MFHVEQAPARFEGKTAGSSFRQDEIEEFIEKNWVPLRNMEFAYIASRYLPEYFRKEEVPLKSIEG